MKDQFTEVRAEMKDMKLDLEHQIQEVRTDMNNQFTEVRAEIASLKNNRFTWNAGLMAAMIALNSVVTIVLIRFFQLIGIKVLATAAPLLTLV